MTLTQPNEKEGYGENNREYRRRRAAMENERKGTRTPGAAWQWGSNHHEEAFRP